MESRYGGGGHAWRFPVVTAGQVSAIVDQLDYQRAFSENTPGIKSSRTPQIMETLADNFGGSFISLLLLSLIHI